MQIRYDGTNERLLAEALQALKPRTKVQPVKLDDGSVQFDQRWPDGQVSERRWWMDMGDVLDTETGATSTPDGDLIDDADVS